MLSPRPAGRPAWRSMAAASCSVFSRSAPETFLSQRLKLIAACGVPAPDTDPLNAKINAAMKWAKGPGAIPRSEIFLTTKVPCCPGTGFCKQPEYSGTIAADMAKNNELLGTEYTDLTLLHHPCDTVAHTIERYVELQDAMTAGHTKAIGVSNFNAELLAQIIADKRVKTVPAVSNNIDRS